MRKSTTDRINAIGLINKENTGYYQVFDKVVTHREVIGTVNGFIKHCQPEKLTVIVMDNARIYHKAVKEAQWGWLCDWVWFLPAYSPELDLIEILWKKIKYEWLP